MRRCKHITPVLQQLHWLPVHQCVQFKIVVLVYKALHQGCSLGLERLGLEAVLRRFFGTSRLGLEGSTSRSRLGLDDITSRSRSRDFSLVNMSAMHQACGYIMKKIMDLTRKKQFVK